MRNGAEAITDLDLAGYVDGQLDDWHSARVEAWLADHPDKAATVMQDISLQRELRLALTSQPPADTRQAVGRLARKLHRDAIIRRTLRMGPAAALAGLVWLVWSGVLPIGVGTVNASARPPEYVTAALAARDASSIRLPMVSMPEHPQLDTEELRAMTGILLPDFDPDWTIIDAQIVPSPQGPGIEIVFDTPDIGRVNHFAVRPGDFAIRLPETRLAGKSRLSWFQIGETAHVLISDQGDTDQLAAAAESLSASLY